MKKLLVMLLGLFVLTGCAQGETEKDSVEESTVEDKNEPTEVAEKDEAEESKTEDEDKSTDSSDSNRRVNNDNLKDFPEYDVLKEELDLEKYEGKVQTDNKGNRVIVFETKDGVKEYKSIFIKKKNRLKIVEFDDEDNLLYNGVLDKKEATEADDSNTSKNTVNNDDLKDFPEYDVLKEELDLEKYEGKVQTDNKGNRVIVFETKDGIKEYKSIFIKKKNRLKIVHFDDEDSVVYNDVI